jgi:flagellar hook-length control protein FliK
MSLNVFFTVPNVVPGAQPTATGHTALSPQLPGQSFLDFILQNFAKDAEAPAKGEDTPLSSDNPLLDKSPELDVAALLAETPEIAEQVAKDGENFDLDILAKIADALALNQQVLDEKLHPELANGLVALKVTPENLPEVKDILETLLIGSNASDTDKTAFADFAAQLEKLVQSDSTASIVINLTPEQITQIKAHIESLKAASAEGLSAEELLALQAVKGDDEKETDPNKLFASFFAGLVNILPPKGNMAPAPVSTATPKVAADVPVKASDDLAAKLNALVTGGDAETIDGEFKDLIQEYTGNKAKALEATSDIRAKANPNAAGPDLSTLQNWPFQSGSFILPAAWNDALPENYILNTTTPVTGSATLTNLVTNAQSAGAAHPAVQIVASALQKNAAANENRNFTLQLDPPELGRIEVRMEFGKDKVLKTHMVIEKPETFVMLQRDGHALEKSLQGIGLDGSDNSLSFELASQDHEFGQNGHHDHGGGGSGNNAGGEDLEIIETTMDWYVDPSTGHMRYDFVV